MSRRMVRIALALAAPVLAVLVLRTFVCNVYLVDSGSMEPTLHGDPEEGELVLVRYSGTPRPERFDLVVLRREGQGANFIKRVVGLPGERIQIVAGDLLVNGERLAASAPRPAPIPIFDSARGSFADEFQFSEELWSETADGWLLESSSPDRLEGRGLAFFRHNVTDGWLRRDGSVVLGQRDAGELVLECEVRLERPGGVLSWSITEGGDRFEARCEGGGVVLLHTGHGPEVVLAEGDLKLGLRSWHRVRLANIDGVVSFELDEQRLEAPFLSDSVPLVGNDPGYRQLLPRAWLGGGAVSATFRDVRLSRDLDYTELGAHGLGEPLALGPDEVFVLGDNSAGSEDSREWGAVRLADVFGFAEAVVWPLAGLRRLVPAQDPSR